MNDSAVKALQRLFETHRIVFWYDEEERLFDAFEGLDLPGVEKLVLENNEFGAKVKVLVEKPEAKFLLYRRGPKPPDAENWLLDLLVAGAEFRTDEASLVLSELGLGEPFRPLVKRAAAFFRDARRLSALKAALGDRAEETESSVAIKAMALCAKVPNPGAARLDHVLRAALRDEARDGGPAKNGPLAQMEACGVLPEFWKALRTAFGYVAGEPGLFDFSLQLFGDAYWQPFSDPDHPQKLFPAARSFLLDWAGDAREAAAFGALANRCASSLEIWADLSTRPLDQLLSVDCFEAVDERILALLADGVEAGTLRRDEVERAVAARRPTPWFDAHADEYEAFEAASAFLSELSTANFAAADARAFFDAYAKDWFRLDRHYRHFTAKARRATEGGSDRLGALTALVDGKYANHCVLPMNTAFQGALDAAAAAGGRAWPPSGAPERQRDFWTNHVAGGPLSGIRLAVIVSDALRYEVAEEIARRLSTENRYVVEIGSMVGELPSYTQLGMAALLPHGGLSILDGPTAAVASDGKSTQGFENRRQLLGAAGGAAAKAEEILTMNKAELLEFEHSARVLFVYHDTIDARGHNAPSEGQTFEAAENAVETIVKIVKKMAGPNHVGNFFIVTDHGFLYQEEPLPDANLVSLPSGLPEGTKTDRRFVLGRNLPPETSGTMKFTARQLGLEGDMEAIVPKASGRFRIQGQGGRYAHGGASLQEIVVPLVTVKRRRGDEVEPVGVQRLQQGSAVVTTSQFVVQIYQVEPVGGKTAPRTVRVSLWSADGARMYSNREEFTFDSASGQAADRIHRFTLALGHEADGAQDADAFLLVEEKIPGSSQWKTLEKVPYKIRCAFQRDF